MPITGPQVSSAAWRWTPERCSGRKPSREALLATALMGLSTASVSGDGKRDIAWQPNQVEHAAAAMAR